MTDIKSILQSSELFKDLADQDLGALVSMCEKRMVLAGDTLAQPGHEAEFYYVLIRGVLMIAMADDRALVLATPGDFAGLELASEKGKYISTLTVLEDGEVMAVPRAEFLELIRSAPEAGQTILNAWLACIDRQASFLSPGDSTLETV